MVTRRKTPTTCYLRQEQLEALRRLNRKSRVPIAVLIREGVDMVLEERGFGDAALDEDGEDEEDEEDEALDKVG